MEWPKLEAVWKVSQVIPRIMSWAPEDEAKLILREVESDAFGVSNDSFVRFLLNLEGEAPCALHSWGSQVIACECGCRLAGLSPKRIAEKGLFGSLVRSTSDQFYQEVRHVHPNECLALQGFDPMIDFGPNPEIDS